MTARPNSMATWRCDLADKRTQDAIREQTAERKRLARIAANLSPIDATPRPPATGRLLTMDDIIDVVGGYFQVTREELTSKRRHPMIVLARRVVTHMIRTHTRYSYPEIARATGRPNHSSVITSHQRLRKLIDEGGAADLPSGRVLIVDLLAYLHELVAARRKVMEGQP